MMTNSTTLLAALTTTAAVMLGHCALAQAGCYDQTVIDQYEAVVTPSEASDCLDVEVEGDGCVPGVHVTIRNRCAEPLVVAGVAYCDDEPSSQTCDMTIEPSDMGRFSEYEFAEGREETRTYAGQLGDVPVTIELTFVASVIEEDGCSIAGSPTRGARSLVPLAMVIGALVVGAGMRRVRR